MLIHLGRYALLCVLMWSQTRFYLKLMTGFVGNVILCILNVSENCIFKVMEEDEEGCF